jgi:hypothetical protein
MAQARGGSADKRSGDRCSCISPRLEAGKQSSSPCATMPPRPESIPPPLLWGMDGGGAAAAHRNLSTISAEGDSCAPCQA